MIENPTDRSVLEGNCKQRPEVEECVYLAPKPQPQPQRQYATRCNDNARPDTRRDEQSDASMSSHGQGLEAKLERLESIIYSFIASQDSSDANGRLSDGTPQAAAPETSLQSPVPIVNGENERFTATLKTSSIDDDAFSSSVGEHRLLSPNGEALWSRVLSQVRT
jgi:hypothetical protein